MNKKSFYALAFVGIAGCLSSWAVPADPRPRQITQPDGSVITLRQTGDEYFNCWLTQDGSPVVEKADGFFYFVGSDGIATDIVVNANSGARIGAQLNIDKNAAYSALRERMLAANPRWNFRQDESKRFANRLRANISASQWDNKDLHDIRNIPTDGKRKVLVILVNFNDMKFSDPDPHKSFTDMLNTPGYNRNGATGSAYDFYRESSGGIYDPSFDVYGPVTLPRSYAYYGQDIQSIDDHAEEMIADAVKLLDDKIDFKQYDTNNDGWVDNVYVFYAGKGQASGGSADTVWPHAYELAKKNMQVELDGVYVSRYACSNEIVSDEFTGIGTFCHEFAHVLGLPDLYDTDNNGTISPCFTPGSFSAMDQGPYNNDGKTPPLFSAYERYALEWLKPDEFEGNGSIQLLPLAVKDKAYIVRDKDKPTEYFLIENRQQIGWDKYIPGHGMLIWHIDFNKMIWDYNRPNNTPGHQCIDIVEADDVRTEGSITGDPFPGTAEIYEFTYNGTPSFVNWSGNSMRHDITDIQESSDGVVSFNVWISGGNDVPAEFLETPKVAVTGSTLNSFKAEWKSVEGAEGYFVSVFDNAEFSSEELGHPVDGWNYADVKDATSVEIRNLEEGHNYSISVYAYSSDKTSRYVQAIPVSLKGKTFDQSAPVIYSKNAGDGKSVTLIWDEVDGAESYLVTVATREEGDVASKEMQSFDNKKFPEDWYLLSSFDNAFYGNSAPSLKFSLAGDCVETGYYDQTVKQISFWARARVNNDKAYIDVYGLDDEKNPHYIGRESGFTSTAETRTVAIPDGIHQVMLYFYRSSADAVLNIDDIEVQFTNGPKDTPVAGYSDFTVNGNSLKVSDLVANTEYVAYVKAKKGNEVSKKSHFISFSPVLDTAVDNVMQDYTVPAISIRDGVVSTTTDDAAFDIYHLDGRCLVKGARSGYQLPDRGLYIVRLNDKAVKICW